MSLCPPFIPHPSPFSPSLATGSLPSVCLCAGGAGCYLDDLVCEGERDFISCLPKGLWYPRCFKAALLEKKRKCIQLWRSTVKQRVRVIYASGHWLESLEWICTSGPLIAVLLYNCFFELMVRNILAHPNKKALHAVDLSSLSGCLFKGLYYNSFIIKKTRSHWSRVHF